MNIIDTILNAARTLPDAYRKNFINDVVTAIDVTGTEDAAIVEHVLRTHTALVLVSDLGSDIDHATSAAPTATTSTTAPPAPSTTAPSAAPTSPRS